MTKTLSILVVMLSTLSISYNAVAHTGMAHASNMHSILHIATGVGVSIALMAVGFFLLKLLPKSIEQRVNK